jgi:F0F1-type ATP synthase membrane subunit a
MIIKRIDILSAAKMYGIIAAAIGLLAGIIFLLFGGLLGGLMGQGHGGGFAALGGFMGVIILPILYGIFGFIGGAIQAFIYNIAAKYVGGLVIETE